MKGLDVVADGPSATLTTPAAGLAAVSACGAPVPTVSGILIPDLVMAIR